ncbi:MAG TPA: hypothetical protein DHN33_00285 [Eubacteriaceae bacterium]|nr:hypothetical protein [Eubacteriaceae bacterium]
MKKNNLYGFIGICYKSRKTIVGDYSLERAIHEKRLHLVMTAKDTSERIAKKYRNLCDQYQLPYIQLGTKTELSDALGRKNVAVVGFTDQNQAANIINMFEKLKKQGEFDE